MPLVEIAMLEGRSDEIKEDLVANVSQTVAESLDIDLDQVVVVLKDLEPGHWAVGGRSIRKQREQA